MTATLHKLTAGDGYTYLTRQVAAGDSTERGYNNLGDYYSMKGEAPGRWSGAGLASLGVSGSVTERQMVNLFGAGLHPDAERIRAEAAAAGLKGSAVEQAAELGQPFRTYQPSEDQQDWHTRLADAYSAFNEVRGHQVNHPIPASDRQRIRTDVATSMFTERYGREPLADRELTSFVARVSRPLRSAVAGYDVTFSPVKSVSTLWAVAPRSVSERIEVAHRAAVEDTVKWIEDNATYTRSGTDGVAQIDVRGLITAQFTHRDSRAGDPDLHTHVAISNKVQALDGRWLALDGRMIHRYLVAASEHYNSRLEAELTERIGARFVDREVAPGKRPVREIEGVDPALNARFSQRRRSITTHRAELVEAFRAEHHRLPTAVELIALAQQANLATREAKHEPKSLGEQREQWQEQAAAVLGSQTAIEAIVAEATFRGRAIEPELTEQRAAELADAAVLAVEARRAQWSRHNILAEAQRQLRYAGYAAGADTDAAVERVAAIALGPEHSVPIGMDPETAGIDDADVPTELTRRDGTSVFRMAGGQLYTSTAVLRAERIVVDAAGEGDSRSVTVGDVEVGMLEWSANNDGRTLNPSQLRMVHEVATSDRRLTLALAPAGTGKTTTMGALAAVWQGTGGNLVALAPQASAAEELAAQIPGVTSDTVDKLVHELGQAGPGELTRWHHEITPDTLVIVDEAGLASTRNLAAVASFAKRQGARVLLVGDDRQRAASGAGGVLRDIEAAHGAVSLDEVMRFRDPQQGRASLAMRAGDPSAVGYYVDQHRLHAVAADSAADKVFDAWHADQAAGINSMMIAPTLDQVTELNLRARAARLAAAGGPEGRTRSLPNGETISAGDLIVTKRNARTLSLGGTDFVKNNHRWIVDSIGADGSITATETGRGITRTLPADYIDHGHVRLGYAATSASVQGLTVDGNAHVILTPDMTRNDAYPAMTRAKAENHGYLVTTGVGDTHEIVRPEAIGPSTAAEIFAGIIERDGADRSALTEIREAEDPHRRMTVAAGAYTHTILTVAESELGDEALADITARAETVVPGLAQAPAWDTLRQHLAVIQLQGRDAIGALTAAAKARELDTAVDPSAVLDWRLDRSGNHSLGSGPLRWLPAVPAALTDDPHRRRYVDARHDLVADLVTAIRADVRTWTLETAPGWAMPYLTNLDFIEELALWRASTGVTATDLRPAGDRPRRIAHQRYHRDLTRAAAVVAGDPADGSGRWRQLMESTGHPEVTADSWWPVLVSRLSAAERTGAPVAQLVADAIASKPLPTDAPAAVLWTRISPHVDLPTETGQDHRLRPSWSEELTTVLGPDTAESIITDRLWPVLVGYVDAAAARHGADPRHLVANAAGMLAAEATTAAPHQHPELLMTHVARLTEPEPLLSEELPYDPADDDLIAPVDAHTALDDPDPRLPGPALDDIELPLPADPQEEPDVDDVDDAAAPNTAGGADRQRLLQVVQAADEFYQAQRDGSWVPGYLADRGLGAITGRAGYAPAGWTGAVDHLRGRGFTDPELLAAGLARTSSRGTLIDAFRDRAVLPVYDQAGDVVAFTGRRNPATVDDYNPKYLNSPTTDLYSKTDLPYGLHPRAVEALRNGADLAIAEGPMDAEAINLATGGRTVAIAPLGTALTEGQVVAVNNLAALTDRDVLTVLDNDDAGRAAAARAHQTLAGAGIENAQTVDLPAGTKDPAEALQTGGRDALAAAFANERRPLADVAVDDIVARWPAPDTPEVRVGALRDAAPLVASLPADLRERQIDRLAGALGLDHSTVTGAVIDQLPQPEPRSLGLPQRPQLSAIAAESLQRTHTPTTELIDRGDTLAQQHAAAQREHSRAAETVRALEAREPGQHERQRQAEILDRAEHIIGHRAATQRLEQLREQWHQRAKDIAATERRINTGGRRAERSEQPHLDQLRRDHEQAAADVRATATAAAQHEAAAGASRDHDQVLAEAQRIHENGPHLIEQAATHDRAALDDARAAIPGLDQQIHTTAADLDDINKELVRRGAEPVDLAAAAHAAAQQPGTAAPRHDRQRDTRDRDIER